MLGQRAWKLSRQMRISLVGLLVLFCAPALLFAAQLIGDKTPKLEGAELIKALKQGGYVIYFRHGATNKFGEKNVTAKDYNNCEIQRNLSPEGVVQTKNIGAAIRRYGIPIGDVYTSPYCRCVDTAMNVFGKAEKTDFLHFAIHTTESNRKVITEKLREHLGMVPQPGKNTGLVSHTTNLMGAVEIFPRPEGVAHIFKPEGNGNFSYVGMMLPDAWLDAGAAVAATEEKEQGWFRSVGRWFRDLF